MHLRRITLHDWKAYENSLSLDFPVPKRGRNVILIGGQNGFGKTSLFEAIVVGLFGRWGLPILARAEAAFEEEKRLKSFKDFLERSINRNALRQGRTLCKIELLFEDEKGNPIYIERSWHFAANGSLKSKESSEPRIMYGHDREIISPESSEKDPEKWYREWICKTFIHESLADFFLFDGEMASSYAELKMNDQIKKAIEGLLGLNWLKQLRDDLYTYADNRRRQVPRELTQEAIDSFQEEISELEKSVLAAEQQLDQIKIDLYGAEKERDALISELAYFGTLTSAQLGDLLKEQAEYKKRYEKAESNFLELVQDDLPIALVGYTLHKRVINRLESEEQRERWLAAMIEGRRRIDYAIQLVDKELKSITPPLLESQANYIQSAVRKALERLWYPPPEGVSDSIRHQHARGTLKHYIKERLKKAASITAKTVDEMLNTIEQSAVVLRRLKEDIESINISESQKEMVDSKRQQLRELDGKIKDLISKKTEKENFISSRRHQLEQKRKELGRLAHQFEKSQRPARLAKRAEKVAMMIDDLIKEARPMQYRSVAEAMTRALQAMVHRKDYLHHVEIEEDGKVKLLTSAGENLREIDLSAGEKQIFTQALFSAVTNVSGRIFPVVIDTPLGRLDEDHRLNLLRHLTERESQVILLSTNTEVVDEYLDAIRDRILKAYLIKNETYGDYSCSSIIEGYFTGQGL